MTEITSQTTLSDERLLELCHKLGALALDARRRFLGLLPEVNRRRLYEKKGFGSIFEFAFRLAGVSEEQVRLALNLNRRFTDKPALQSLLINGEVSMNKLARVVSIATTENQIALAEQVKILPKTAIDTLVKDEKNEHKSLYVQTLFKAEDSNNRQEIDAKSDILLSLNADIIKELHELQQKGIDINKLIREALDRRKTEIAKQKEELAAEIQNKPYPISRYIPVRIKKIIRIEHGKKCSVQTCSKPAQVIHHTARFGLTSSHDPHFLAPLCKEHHIIAHTLDSGFHIKRHHHNLQQRPPI